MSTVFPKHDLLDIHKLLLSLDIYYEFVQFTPAKLMYREWSDRKLSYFKKSIKKEVFGFGEVYK